MRASTPANGADETAAPPACSARSSTSTRRPARASIVAATRPLWPAPTTIASTAFIETRGPSATAAKASSRGLRARCPLSIVTARPPHRSAPGHSRFRPTPERLHRACRRRSGCRSAPSYSSAHDVDPPDRPPHDLEIGLACAPGACRFDGRLPREESSFPVPISDLLAAAQYVADLQGLDRGDRI